LNILGISCFYHDSAAALVQNGKVVAAVEEERFTRKKHTSDFPHKSVQYCLDTAGLKINDIDYVGFYELPENKFDRLISTHMHFFPHTYEQFEPFAALWFKRNLRMEAILREELKYEKELVFIDHHLAHAASAYLPSGFDKSAILTIDGVGEWTTTAWGIGEGNKIELRDEMRFPDSLGLLYSAVTYYLGFKVNSGEGKLMGLTSYGKPTYRDKFNELIEIRDDGSFKLNLDYFKFHKGLEMIDDKFDKLFNCRREPESEIKPEHENLACSLQVVLEEAILKMVRHIHKETGLTTLCIGGGVGLNSVTNGKILKETPIKDIFIQPAASDAGSSLGCALYINNCILDDKTRWKMDAYLGHEITRDDTAEYLKTTDLKYRELSEDELVNEVAKMVADNKIVGWCQGRMEFGPRALGNRTIIANACHPEMKDIINRRVKFREVFRPYAASVLEDKLGEYFDFDYTSPFMLLVYNVLEDKKDVIPSVTHVDGTCRVQSITPEYNPIYYKLIKKFYEITGVPMILNTSFNVRGEPIVRDVKEAINCFIKSDMDALAIDKFLLIKER
jgi:carbamoyltransferase